MRLLICLLVLISTSLHGQESKTFTLRTIAFYNCENLFDTENDSLTFDDDRTPDGSYHWTQERYRKKVENLSKVLAQIGEETSKTSPDIIGLSEVENRKVVEDLVHHPNILDKGYEIIHFDSPDERGIDVALLYKSSSFLPTSFKSHRLLLFDDMGEREYTRDQLVVGGIMDDEELYFIVNHWPSRSGGEARSRPKRIAAAKVNKRIIDSLQSIDPYAKIVTMGDLNDDPTNASVKDVLKAERNKDKVDFKGIYNPYIDMFKKEGLGTTAYRDAWSLFDQIMFTKPFLEKDYSNFTFFKAGIYNKKYLENKEGRYKGYPLRSFSNGNFTDGFSDHFPVYIQLIKEVKEDNKKDKNKEEE